VPAGRADITFVFKRRATCGESQLYAMERWFSASDFHGAGTVCVCRRINASQIHSRIGPKRFATQLTRCGTAGWRRPFVGLGPLRLTIFIRFICNTHQQNRPRRRIGPPSLAENLASSVRVLLPSALACGFNCSDRRRPTDDETMRPDRVDPMSNRNIRDNSAKRRSRVQKAVSTSLGSGRRLFAL